MTDLPLWASIAAMAVTLTTFVLTWRAKAGAQYVELLQARIKALEDTISVVQQQLSLCIAAREALERERLQLLRRVMRGEGRRIGDPSSPEEEGG
jgi:hypothetical protein